MKKVITLTLILGVTTPEVFGQFSNLGGMSAPPQRPGLRKEAGNQVGSTRLVPSETPAPVIRKGRLRRSRTGYYGPQAPVADSPPAPDDKLKAGTQGGRVQFPTAMLSDDSGPKPAVQPRGGMAIGPASERQRQSELPQPSPPSFRVITKGGALVELLADCRKFDELPAHGRRQIILAPIDNQLHVRVFDRDATMVLDASESQLGIKPTGFYRPQGMSMEEHHRGFSFVELRRFFRSAVDGHSLEPGEVSQVATRAEFLFGGLAHHQKPEIDIPQEALWEWVSDVAGRYRSHLTRMDLQAETLYLVLEAAYREFEAVKTSPTERPERSMARTKHAIVRGMFVRKTIGELRAARTSAEALRPELLDLVTHLVEQVRAEGSDLKFRQSKEVHHLRLIELEAMKKGLFEHPVSLPRGLDDTEKFLDESLRVMLTTYRTAQVRDALKVNERSVAMLVLSMDSLTRVTRSWSEEELRQWKANVMPGLYKAIGASRPPVEDEARKLGTAYAAVTPEPATAPESESGKAGN